jgi:hypothetical protein
MPARSFDALRMSMLGEQRQSVLAYDDEGGQQHGPTR